MKLRIPLLAAALALPFFAGACSNGVALPPGVCDPGGSVVVYALPNQAGQIDMSRYSTDNCRK
jgi:hypothetical protein